ncbi:hypothetical protein KCP77_06125 [Salmonella enterica subsp. enterica]|nr:hypothetical protein KCP77_06125 [Salmonella enterica subsp. enterica]
MRTFDSRSDVEEGHARNDLTTARFWATPENLPTIYPKRASCTWNIALPLQKSPDVLACCAINNLRLPCFSLYLTGANSSATGAFQNNINSYGRERKMKIRALLLAFGHGDGADRLPEYGL